LRRFLITEPIGTSQILDANRSDGPEAKRLLQSTLRI
jgi:hypothetical protein